MKKRNRLMAILLAAAMVITYMPALAFADPGDTGTDSGQETGVVQDESTGAKETGAADVNEENEATESDDEGLTEPQKSSGVSINTHFEDFEGGDGDTPVTYYNDDGIEQTAYRTTDGFAYTLVNSDGLNTVRIVGYNGGGTIMDVPEEINDHVVSGFSIDPEKPLKDENYDSIRTIKLPDSMIYFRTKNLKKFKGLKMVTGRDGELNNDFYKTAEGVLYKKCENGLKAFYPQAKADTTWTMDKDLNRSVDFPENCPLETVNLSSAYSDYYSLNVYCLPNLKATNVPRKNEKLKSVDGVLFDKEGERLLLYPSKKQGVKYTVPRGVTCIEDNAFDKCSNLETIELPSSLETISYNAFESCTGLTSITIPENVSGIYNGAFNGCVNLKKIIFTAQEAPSAADLWRFYGVKEAYSNYGTVIEYPEGADYSEFIAAVCGGMVPVPDDPIELEAGELETVSIKPGEVKTFIFTAPEIAQYGYNVWSATDDELNYEHCNFTKNFYGSAFVQQVTAQKHDEYNDQSMFGLVTLEQGSSAYIQIRSCADSTADFEVKIFRTGPIGLAELDTNCPELSLGETVNGTTDTANDVVTYKFTTGDIDYDIDDDDEVGLTYRFEITRTEPEANEWGWIPYFDSALLTEGSAYSHPVTYGQGTESSGTDLLRPNTTYYLQLRPNSAGPYSIKVSKVEREIRKPFPDISDVPVQDIDTMSAGEEKDVHVDEDESKVFTYVFVPKKDGDYTFMSEGKSNTVGRVLEGDNEIGTNDDSSISGEDNFAVCFHAVAGQTYYLQAKAYEDYEEVTFTLKLNEYIGEHKHNYEYQKAVLDEEKNKWTIAHYKCTVCGAMYADQDCRHRVYDSTMTVDQGDLVTGIDFEPTDGFELEGEIGSKPGRRIANTIYNIFEPGNKFIVHYDDKDDKEYECVRIESEDEWWVGYYLDGDPKGEDLLDYLSAKVNNENGRFAEGDNEVLFSLWKDGQYAECTVNVKGGEPEEGDDNQYRLSYDPHDLDTYTDGDEGIRIYAGNLGDGWVQDENSPNVWTNANYRITFVAGNWDDKGNFVTGGTDDGGFTPSYEFGADKNFSITKLTDEESEKPFVIAPTESFRAQLQSEMEASDEDQRDVNVYGIVTNIGDTAPDLSDINCRENNWLWGEDMHFRILRAGISYDREEDRSELPGWGGDIDRYYNGSIRNTENPNGTNFSYEVNDVTAVAYDWDSWDDESKTGKEISADTLLKESLRKDYENNDKNSENFWWHYDIKDDVYGILKFHVDVAENAWGIEDYDFYVYIVNDVYEVKVYSEDGRHTGMPGTEFTVRADAHHKYIEEVDGRRYQRDTSEDLEYDWSFDYGGEFAELEEVEDEDHNVDPSVRTLRLKEPADDVDWMDEGIRVRVKIKGVDYGAQGGTPAEEKVSNHDDYRVSTEYTEIWPVALDSGLDVGASLEFKPELRQYSYFDKGFDGYNNEGYRVIDNASYGFWYDSNAFEIKDNSNVAVIDNGDAGEGNEVYSDSSKFTFTRNGEWGTNVHVNAVWTENGEEQYAGGDYWFNNLNYDVWFENETDKVYDDGDLNYTLNVDNLKEIAGDSWSNKYKLSYKIGTGKWEKTQEGEDVFKWDTVFAKKSVGNLSGSQYSVAGFENGTGQYSLSDDGTELTLDGDAILKQVEDGTNFRIYVEVENKNTHTALSDEETWCLAKNAVAQPDYEEERDVLPGWDGSIEDNFKIHYENTAYPDGYDKNYQVTGAEVNAESAAAYLDGYDANKWWYYKVKDLEEFDDLEEGSVEFTVHYIDPEKQLENGQNPTDQYTFKLNIVNDVFETWMWCEGNRDHGFPGVEFDLHADAAHKYYDEDGQYREDSYEDLEKEGYWIEWRLDYDDKFASLSENKNDRLSAKLKFKNIQELGEYWDAEEGIDEESRVRVILAKDKEDNEEGENGGILSGILNLLDADDEDEGPDVVAESDRLFWLRDHYTLFCPLELDSNLDLYDSIENVGFELREYKLGGGEDEGYVEDADTGETYKSWSDYDSNKFSFDESVLSITYKKDGDSDPVSVESDKEVSTKDAKQFTITRTGTWDTDLYVGAIYDEDGEEREEGREYHFDGKDYRIWFDPYEDVVFRNEDVTFKLESRDLPKDANISYTIVRGDGDPLPDGSYTISQDGRSVTIHGAGLAAAEDPIQFVKLRAEATKGDNLICKSYEENDWAVCRFENSDWEPFLLARAHYGEEFDDGDTLYIDPDEPVFIEFKTDNNKNLNHGLAPLVGWYDTLTDEEGNPSVDEHGKPIGDLSKLGFDVTAGTAKELGVKGDDIDDDTYGILIDGKNLDLGTTGTLHYYLYKYEGSDFWGDFENGNWSWSEAEVARTNELNVTVAANIDFNNHDDETDLPLFYNGTKTYQITIPKDAEALGNVEFHAGAIGDEGFKPFIDLTNGHYSNKYGNYADGKLTLSGNSIYTDENFDKLYEVEKDVSRNLHIRAWIKNDEGAIVAIGHANCLVTRPDADDGTDLGQKDVEAYFVDKDEKPLPLVKDDDYSTQEFDAMFYVSHAGQSASPVVTVGENHDVLEGAGYKARYSEVKFNETEKEWQLVDDTAWSDTFPTAPGVYLCEIDGVAPNYGVKTWIDLIRVEDHDWGNVTADWAEDYSKVTASRACNICNKTESETVATVARVTSPATCNEKGETTYITRPFRNAALENFADEDKTRVVENINKIGHNWAAPSYEWITKDGELYCKATRTCLNDTPHVPETEEVKAAEVTVPASCTEAGSVTYTASFTNTGFAEQTKIEVIPALGHDYRDVVTPATCETKGYTTHTCSREGCGVSYVDNYTNALGHDWGEWSITEPTETEPGVKTRTCKNDGSHTEAVILPVKDHEHVLVKTDAVDPTCTTDGHIAYWTCDGGSNPCGHVFSDAEGKNEITLEDTVIPAFGHDYQDVVTPPTCETKGYTTHTCGRCGDSYVDTYVPELSHNWTTKYVKDNYGSVTATRICANDVNYDHVQSEVGRTTATVTKKPTCTEPGDTTYTVSFNNINGEGFQYDSWTDEGNIPATKHSWKEPVYTWNTNDKGEITGVTATLVCKNDAKHVIVATAVVTQTSGKPQKVSDGLSTIETTYTATEFVVDHDGSTAEWTEELLSRFEPQTKTVTTTVIDEEKPAAEIADQVKQESDTKKTEVEEAIAAANQETSEVANKIRNENITDDDLATQAGKAEEAVKKAEAAVKAAEDAVAYAQAALQAAIRALEEARSALSGAGISSQSEPASGISLLRKFIHAEAKAEPTVEELKAKVEVAKAEVAEASLNKARAGNELQSAKSTEAAIASIQTKRAINNAAAIIESSSGSAADTAAAAAAAQTAQAAAEKAARLAREAEQAAVNAEDLANEATNNEFYANLSDGLKSATNALVEDTNNSKVNAQNKTAAAEQDELSASELALKKNAEDKAAQAGAAATTAAGLTEGARTAVSAYEAAVKNAQELSEKAKKTLDAGDRAKARQAVKDANNKKTDAEAAVKALNDAVTAANDAIEAASQAALSAAGISGFDAGANANTITAANNQNNVTASDLSDIKSAEDSAKSGQDKASSEVDQADKTAADIAAQAERDRIAAEEKKADDKFNGTPDGTVPKVKGMKAKAGKKSIAVSWKKANKKTLKKYDGIEVQYSLNPNFPRGSETISRELGKKKKSLKIKGLAKGTYYVRVRYFKRGGDTGKLVGQWTKKKAKVKK